MCSETSKANADKIGVVYLTRFIDYLSHERRYSVHTVGAYEARVKTFFEWISGEFPALIDGDGNSIDPSRIEAKHGRDFLIEHRDQYSVKTLHNYFSALRSFFNYLVEQKIIPRNPIVGQSLPKLPKSLPLFFTEGQIKQLLDLPMNLVESGTIERKEGLRDMLIFELLYCGGFRVSELIHIKYGDIDWGLGTVRVRGKGAKERIVPIGLRATQLIAGYRGEFGMHRAGEADFVFCYNDKPLYSRYVQLMLKRYLRLAGLPVDLSPHKIRHTFATHLLGNGAKIRSVQEMLGHANLSSTQIYTHLDVNRLKSIHLDAHPRNR